VEHVARKIATLLLERDHCLFGQHIKGKQNTVSDLLSYSTQQRGDGQTNPLAVDEPTDDELTRRFHQHLSQVIPEYFTISPLPPAVLSFAVQALQQTAERSWIQSERRPTKRKMSLGAVGKDSASMQESITSTSISYPSRPVSSSCDHSSPPAASLDGVRQDTLFAAIRNPYRRRLCELPQATWLRRSGTISN
jgi:hypothetical protein